MRLVLALAAAAAAKGDLPEGSLLYVVQTSLEPFTLGLAALDLQKSTETIVVQDLGAGLGAAVTSMTNSVLLSWNEPSAHRTFTK